MLDKLIKLPVAKLGSWFHESLGVISFSQADLEDIRRNFTDNARGYEPYVRYGHHEQGPGVFQGEKALAHCVHMAQEGEVLYGYFKPVTPEVLAEVEQGLYRYSSAEFIKNARDRETNQALGRLLLGVALTNSPCVPWLPRNAVVQADTLAVRLSDDLEPLAFPIELETHDVMMDPKQPYEADMSESQEAEPKAEQMAEMPEELADEQPNLLVRTLTQVGQFLQRIETVLTKQGEPAPMAEETMMQPEAEAPQAEATEAPEAPEAPETEAPEAPEAPEAAEAPEAPEAPEAEEEAMPEPEAQPEADALQAKLMAAEAALKAAQEALAAKADEAQKLEHAYKEREFALMLSDRVKAMVAQGVPPAAAEKAAQLVNALQAQAETLMLSDRQVSLVDAVFELLADRTDKVEFAQAGTVEASEPFSVNPWLKRTEGLKAQAAAK